MKNLDLENFKLYKSKFTNHHNHKKGYRVIDNISYKSYLGLMCPFCYEFKIIKLIIVIILLLIIVVSKMKIFKL